MRAPRRPRIAHVINSVGLGGVPEAAYQLLRALPRQRYDARLHVLKRPDAQDAARLARLERFRALDLPVSFAERPSHRLGLVTSLARWLEAECIDLLHCHSYKPNISARLAGTLLRSNGLRIVAHYHNQYDANWQRDGTLDLDRILARQTSTFVAVSGSVRDHMVERLAISPGEVTVIPNGVGIAQFQTAQTQEAAREALGLPSGRPIIGLVGRISEQKGQEDLIRAAPSLLAAFPEARIVFAGAPDEAGCQRDMEELIRQLGIGHAVEFRGFLTDMAGFYRAIDLLAAPSRWEGFGLMLVEAMAAGVPIVAARVGAIPEVVVEGETSLLVSASEPAALAGAIVALLRDPATMRRFAVNGQERAQQFSWQRAGAALDRVYRTLLDTSLEAPR
jgi:glycosyltransferase involved in cell wall biosynthesis